MSVKYDSRGNEQNFKWILNALQLLQVPVPFFQHLRRQAQPQWQLLLWTPDLSSSHLQDQDHGHQHLQQVLLWRAHSLTSWCRELHLLLRSLHWSQVWITLHLCHCQQCKAGQARRQTSLPGSWCPQEDAIQVDQGGCHWWRECRGLVCSVNRCIWLRRWHREETTHEALFHSSFSRLQFLNSCSLVANACLFILCFF